MAEQTPLEAFRQVLGGAARAMAHEPELELSYTAEAPSLLGKQVKVPMPSRTLPAEQVAEARGFADGYALKLRHHDAATHMRNIPADPVAAACFTALENARVEALGAKGMEGVRQNLAHALELRMRSDPISRARNREEVPISTALGLMMRMRLTGEAPPDSTVAGLQHVSGWIREKAGAQLDALAMLIDDQAAFGHQAWLALQSLDLVQGETDPTDEDDSQDGEGEDQEEGQSEEQGEDDSGGSSDSEVESRAEQDQDGSEDGESREVDDDSASDVDSDMGAGGRRRRSPAGRGRRSGPPGSGCPDR